MATVYAANDFETGQPDGTPITAANSGGAAGRAFDLVDGLAAYSTLAAHGSLAALLDQGTNGRCQLQWTDPADTAGTCWARFYLFAAATPGGNTRILHFNDATGAQAFALQWRSDGVVRLYDGPSTNMAQSTWTLPVGQWVRVEVMVVLSATAGQAEARIYATDPDGSTPDQTLTSGDVYNTLGAVGMWRWGPTAGPDNLVLRMDDLGVSFDGWIGPAVTGPPPELHDGSAALGAAATVTAAGRKGFASAGQVDAGAVGLAATGRKDARGPGRIPGTLGLTVSGGKATAGAGVIAGVIQIRASGYKGTEPPPVTPPAQRPASPRPAFDWTRRGVTYRYEFADMRTDSTLAVLPMTGVTFDRRICQPGALRGTIPVANREVAEHVQKVVPRDDSTISTGPGRTVCHVYRNESIWGTYAVWAATPQGDDRGRVTVPIQGASLESYFDHREIRRDIDITAADQLDIARYLIAHAQTWGDDSSIGVEVGGQEASGILRDRSYRASEAATYLQRLTELSQVIDGPEWMIRTWVDPATGRRRREFIVGMELGADAPGQVWAQPGNILTWQYPADATDAATSWQTRGDTIQGDVSADSEPLISNVWENARFKEAGWPLLERTVDYQGVTRVDTLDQYARWWAVNRSGMIRIPQATVRLPEVTSFHPNNLGGRDTFKLQNVWFPGGTFSRSWRVIGVEVTPVSREDGQERVKLIFEEPSDDAAAQRGDAGDAGGLTVPGVPTSVVT